MKLFYRAVSKDGKVVRGEIEAKDADTAAGYLRKHDLIPIKIAEQLNIPFLKSIPLGSRFSKSDLLFFTSQLSSMLSSGLTLMQALAVLRKQIKKQALQTVVEGIIIDIEEGSSFSQAIVKHPEAFSPIYVSLIKASETSGLLDKILVRLADTLEKQEKLRSEIKGALLYPVIVIIMMVVVVAILMIVVIPQLSSLYESLSVDLPITTKILVGMSKFTTQYWPFVIVAFPLVVYSIRRWYKTEAGKIIIDDLILRMPILGKLIRNTVLAEFSRTFGLLVGSGTLVVDALDQSASVVGNAIYEHDIHEAAKRVEKGVTVGNALEVSTHFPPLLVQLTKIGEQTGKIDENLMRASEYFEREAEVTVKTLTTVLEPILMVFLGVGVAFIIISIIVPIYTLIQKF